VIELDEILNLESNEQKHENESIKNVIKEELKHYIIEKKFGI
jgi:predicted SprT family Zn-dependent metalloprotease